MRTPAVESRTLRLLAISAVVAIGCARAPTSRTTLATTPRTPDRPGNARRAAASSTGPVLPAGAVKEFDTEVDAEAVLAAGTSNAEPEPLPPADHHATADEPPFPSGPHGGSLGVEVLLQMALQNNPTLSQAAAQVEAARGRAIQAGLCPNPVLGYEGDEVGAGGNAGQQGIFIEQLIVTGGKLHLSRQKFSQEIVQGQWQALAQQYRVLNGVRVQFYDVLALQRLVEVQEQLLALAEDAAITTEQLTNVGQANRPDLLQARVEVQQRRIALVNTQARRRAAWQELAALVGNPYLPPARLEGDLEQAPQEIDMEATWARLLEASPEIQIARADVSRTSFALRREEVEPIPNVELRGSTQYNAGTENQQAGVEVGFRLPIFDRNQGNIRAAHGELIRAQWELQRIQYSLRDRLAAVYAEYVSSRTVVESYRETVLPQTQEAYELYLAGFQQQRAAWPQVLIAQRNFVQAQIEYVEALRTLRSAEVALQGLLLVDGLEQPPALPSGDGGELSRDRGRISDRLSEPVTGREGRGADERIGNRPN
jgi:cobalt-zinc-cadmium efflux system outer membrane protein